MVIFIKNVNFGGQYILSGKQEIDERRLIMNPYEISQDPAWHHWVDGVVILVIGIAAGLVMAQAFLATQSTTITTDGVRRLPSVPQVESGIRTDLPPTVKIEES